MSQCYSQPKNGFPFHSRSAQETLLPSNTCVLLCAPKNIGPQANCKLVSRTWVWFKLQGTTENVDTSVRKLPPRSVSNYLSIYLQGFQCFQFPLRQHLRTSTLLCRFGNAHSWSVRVTCIQLQMGLPKKLWIFVPFAQQCANLIQFAWGNGEFLKHQLRFHCILW